MKILPPVSIEARRLLPGPWDLLAAVLVLGLIVLCADASRAVIQPLTSLERQPISLDPSYLPGYALRTGLRMLVALGVSLIFTFSYATWAAKSPRAGTLLVPLLDILQSIPILGFLSVTLVFFLSLAPGRILGAEFAAIFLIFTSQAWNMAFSFYQSLRTVPTELTEAGRVFGLNAWARFWRIEVPFGMPQLIWNMMMSMSGAWFMLVVSEAFTVGNTSITLPGIGSYIAAAIAAKSLKAIVWAILAMLVVIIIFDQLLFRPLVAWADRFRIDAEPGDEATESWALAMFRRSKLIDAIGAPFDRLMHWSYQLTPPARRQGARSVSPIRPWIIDAVWYACLGGVVLYALWQIAHFAAIPLGAGELINVVLRGFATLTRVLVLIALASAIWTPIGIYVGLRPHLSRIVQPVAQFLSAFPANLLFPIVVSLIVMWKLNPNIWLSPLMVLGTQWYILFNVIAGASALPHELRDASDNFQIKGWLWWRKVALPAVFPYYVTGAITASGGSWNAAIVAEIVEWGHNTLRAYGLGSYITDASTAGDFRKIVLGIAVMSFFVVVVNRLFWRPLYWYAERKFRLG
ncbi:MAG: ABC transporter permease subunit [Alphaproteobacteria bacterium]|nr:ABC transporter permease subunit [Alphaproteobacteria bacterium]MDE2494268.1 ABC transporter permease subunit [Alphaproteobacteria bacterium]